MKTIVINGSPKGKKGNTEIFIQKFITGMNKEVLVKRIVEEEVIALANLVKEYDTIIMALPLYIHSMPGIVMRFIESLEVNNTPNKKQIGFILQFGFSEGFQGKYVESYFESLADELHMTYLGTLMKPEAAAIYTMPSIMTKRLFTRLRKFGVIFEQTNTFDESIMKKMKEPYIIRGFKLSFIRFIKKIGLMNFFWNKFLKENHAFENRYNRPYI